MRRHEEQLQSIMYITGNGNSEEQVSTDIEQILNQCRTLPTACLQSKVKVYRLLMGLVRELMTYSYMELGMIDENEIKQIEVQQIRIAVSKLKQIKKIKDNTNTYELGRSYREMSKLLKHIVIIKFDYCNSDRLKVTYLIEFTWTF